MSGGKSALGRREGETRAMQVFRLYELASARTVQDLVRVAAEASGKVVSIRDVDEPNLGTVTALTYHFNNRSVIVLRQRDDPYYRARGLFHEIGHILFEHPGCKLLTLQPQNTNTIDPPEVWVSEANLTALYRDDPHELEAEALATLIGRHLLRPVFEADERVFG